MTGCLPNSENVYTNNSATAGHKNQQCTPHTYKDTRVQDIKYVLLH